MLWTILLAFAYGIVTILLGVVGFVHGGSKASLIAGGITGIIAVGGAALAKHHPKVGFGLVFLMAIATLPRFAMGFMKTKHLYPDGVIALVAVVGIVAGIAGFFGLAKS